jgi:hypothetical protein
MQEGIALGHGLIKGRSHGPTWSQRLGPSVTSACEPDPQVGHGPDFCR